MKSNKTKKTFSLSVGTIITGIIIVAFIIIFIMNINSSTTSQKEEYQSNNSTFSNSKLKSINDNKDYENTAKIKMKDLNIGEIYCGMKLEKMFSVLGECNNIYETSLSKDSNYQTYRYDEYNLNVDVDKNSKIVKSISYAGNGFQNKKGIRIGSTVSEVISAYHSEKKIAEYENNQGVYKVLYNSDDVFDYVYNNVLEGKSLGYIYQYEGQTYSIEYIEKGMNLTFKFLDDKVSLISMSYK